MTNQRTYERIRQAEILTYEASFPITVYADHVFTGPKYLLREWSEDVLRACSRELELTTNTVSRSVAYTE